MGGVPSAAMATVAGVRWVCVVVSRSDASCAAAVAAVDRVGGEE